MGAGGWVIWLVAALLSMFSPRQMQALRQELWILCAKLGVAWHIPGVEKFQTRTSLFSRDRAVLLPFRLLPYCDRVREVKPCSTERVTLGYD